MNASKWIILISGIIFIMISVFQVIKIISIFNREPAFEIHGETASMGVFDPSVEFAPESDTGYFVYTAILGQENGRFPLIGVHLAVSNNGGEDWRFRQEIFESKPGTLTYLGAKGQSIELYGVWRYEMPSLVYTPGDTGREWKIYAYRYFWNGNIGLARQTGTIVYKHAADPAGEWSQEQWLFSADPYNPPAPYNRMVLLHVNVLDPELKDVIAYSDPAAFFYNGVLYVTLSGYTEIANPARLILIASKDYGASWQFVGNVLTGRDIGFYPDYSRFSAGQIIEKDGAVYLLAALGDERQRGTATAVFKFSDLKTGQLVRDQNGAPKVFGLVKIPLENTTTLGGGPADYSAQAQGGLYMSSMVSGAEQLFKIEQFGHDFLIKE